MESKDVASLSMDFKSEIFWPEMCAFLLQPLQSKMQRYTDLVTFLPTTPVDGIMLLNLLENDFKHKIPKELPSFPDKVNLYNALDILVQKKVCSEILGDPNAWILFLNHSQCMYKRILEKRPLGLTIEEGLRHFL